MTHHRPAPWRDERVIGWLIQIAVAAVLLAVLVFLADRTLDAMRAKGLVPGLGFLTNTAGFAIGEGGAFDPASDTYLDAFRIGLINTLRVAAVAALGATLLGILVALGRLSANPLVRWLATAFVEVFRNTPLLVQLLFWYQGVVLTLPDYGNSLALGARQTAAGGAAAWAFLSQRGLALPRLATDPWSLSLPEMARFNYAGGVVLTPEFTALALGLAVYSAAFIAEVIRGGVISVPPGQREAARAVGLGEGQLLRLIVLPQALRVIIPPLTSQYLNLVKNSTLGIYVGYPDLFNVSQTIGNNTGQFVVVTGIVMVTYLAISLATSLAMNLYNRRVQQVAR
jgi:general L-amino acid transport system permease protein